MNTQTQTKEVALPGYEIEGLIMPGQVEGLEFDVPIPILKVQWADERQWCGLVHQYLDGWIEGRPDEYQGCSSNRAGQCGGNGWKDPCLFLEPESSKGWARARQWELITLEDGTEALQKREQPAGQQAGQLQIGIDSMAKG